MTGGVETHSVRQRFVQKLHYYIVMLFLGLVFIVGAIGLYSALMGPTEPWGRYDYGIQIGVLDGEVINYESIDGIPTARESDFDEAVFIDISFHRCGPDEDLTVRSRRTWIVTWVDSTGLQTEPIAGSLRTVEFQAVDGCIEFVIDIQVPQEVVEFMKARPGSTATVTFDIDPIGESKYGPVIVTTDQFTMPSIISSPSSAEPRWLAVSD